MQEQNMDQPTSLSQLLRESYLSEARAYHRHGESSCIDSSRHLVYGALKEKADAVKLEAQFPDLSAFLSQEELDNSVDLARKAISHEPREDLSDGRHSDLPSNKSSLETAVVAERQSVQDDTVRTVRTSREPPPDFKRPLRNSPFGDTIRLETQSKKEFLNKAADFIEELSSLFKANSSKRIRPRSCKAQRNRYQNKGLLDGAACSISTEDRERPVLQQREQPMENLQRDPVVEEPVSPCEMERCDAPAVMTEEPACEPPHFIQKLKSREVAEGSKVQLDCIVRGLPAPEVRWFCEGIELDNSPDIQIISNADRHSLIIAEAFEEDTGRYSCFASNFYGTDSTSAEIYIEGASSSDSDGEQAQHHKRVASPETDVTPDASLEDSTAAVRILRADPPAASDTHDVPLTHVTFDPPSVQEHTEHLSSEIISSHISELDSSMPLQIPAAAVCQVDPGPQIPQSTVSSPPPPPPSSQNISNILTTTQQSNAENLNGSGSFLQSLDVRSIMAAPVFTKNLQDVLAEEGQLVVLECRMKGNPSPKVNWYREGMLIDDSPDFRILQKKPRSMSESEEICTLVIAEVFPEDSGTFTCTASNKYGTVSSTAVLRVKGCNHKSTNSKATCTLMVESSHQKVAEPAKLITSSFKRELDVPPLSNKHHSSMVSLDPLSLDSTHCVSQNAGTRLQDSLTSSELHHDLTMSLPSLSPQSIGKLHSNTFRSSLTHLDPLRFNVFHLDPLSSESKHKSLSSFSTHFNSDESALKSSMEATQSPNTGSASTITLSSDVDPIWVEPSLNAQIKSQSTLSPSVISPPPKISSNNNEHLALKPLPDPPTSCLKTRSEGVSVNHNESRSSSRVGLRVTFKLPEDEEEEEKSMSCNKEPPPVLAKPKLDPVQLQILHNQVLLEQQQDDISPGQDGTQSVIPVNPPSNSASSQLKSPHLVRNSGPVPQLITASVPVQPVSLDPILKTASGPQLSMSLPNSVPLPQPSPIASTLCNSHPTPQQNLIPSIPQSGDSSPLVTQTIVVPSAPQFSIGPISSMTQFNVAPVALMPSAIPHTPITTPAPNIPMSQSSLGPTTPLPRFIMASTTQSNTNYMVSFPPVTPPTRISQINATPTLQMNSVPVNEIDMTVAKTHPVITPGAEAVNNSEAKVNTTPLTPHCMAPSLIQDTQSLSVSSIAPLSKLTSPPPAVISSPPLNFTQAHLSGILPVSTQSFSYTRPKEFIASQTLSPIRCPSPTESPVPMLHELAAQIFPKSTRELTSPVNQFVPSPRKFPTRILESPGSSPAYVSSPPLVPPGLVNSVFAFRPQSPPQASSPTSSSSTPSPIQNPVAFLSSVLPSLPTSPPTNAMGLPKRAPPGPQALMKKNHRGLRPMSADDIRDSRCTLLKDIEKRLQFKDVPLRLGQQKLSYGGEVSRPLGPNVPTATVINYHEEYKVSSFEQRLMSEIEFRLERTPVEESDDEVQHDEIPSGKCIAPIFDKKLKNFRAVEGVPVTLTCKVVGIPIPKVYWFKDGKQILKKNNRYQKIREGDGTCSLHIQAATSDDDGNYTVMVANPQGRISCSGHLIVQTGPVRNRPVVHTQRVRARVQEVEGEPTQERFFRPHFLQAPGDMLAHEGHLCRLDCKVSGLPLPEIMWLLNGKPKYPDESHRMLVRENGVHSLVIDPLTQDDDGTYTCIAANKAGQSSFCLELRVVEKEMKQAPHFAEKLQNTGVAEGAPVRLECRVMGMPQPVIYWKKDNDTISQAKDRLSMHQDTTGYVCLLIQPTRKEDAGWYTVSAKNEAGIASCTARLDIYAQWHQHVHPPMKKTQLTGSRYAALTCQGLDIKSAFPTSDGGSFIFSASQSEPVSESEEL